MRVLPQHPHSISFGDFVLDIGRGALLKRGKEVRLRPQSYDVLRILVAQHGRLVTKSQLQTEIWGNKVVTDDSLTHCLLDIRKALGDTDKSIIRTVPRRGYIFELPCEIVEGSATSNRSAHVLRRFTARPTAVTVVMSLIAVVMIAWVVNSIRDKSAASVRDRSVAVLPFVDTSEAQNQQYLGDGLSDDILNLLAHSSKLRVIARTSSFSFAGNTPDIKTIGDILNVAYVLEGSVRRSADKLIVTAQLVDTANSSNVWSKRYEKQTDDLSAIQRDIAQAVLSKIASVDGKASEPLVVRNFSASELMLLARFYEQEVREHPEVDRELLDEAIGLYRDAISADPDSALAHSRLGSALLYGGKISEAETPILKAVELAPNISAVQKTLGDYFWARKQPGAGAAWKRAMDLNPNNADAIASYAYWYWMQGYDDRSEELFRRALELDPLSLARHAALGEYLAHQGKVNKTLEVIGRIEKRFSNATAHRVISRLYELVGEVDKGIAWAIKARDLEPANPDHISALAELYAEIGDFETARKLEPKLSIGLLFKMRRYDELIEMAEYRMIDEPNDIYLRYLLAFAYNSTGNSEGALRILRTLGQPAAQRSEVRQPLDIEAFVIYVDALDASGASKQASELAEWMESAQHTKSTNWWIHVQRACWLAVLGRDDLALQRIERVTSSPRLPWNTSLKDAHCFARYQDDPRYHEVLQQVDSRRQGLRERLPETLQAYSVVL